MKLAEALNLRADCQKRIQQLSARLNLNAKVQEGDTPAEAPQALLKELEEDITALERLIGQINLTNSRTVSNGETLTELIARRDALGLKNSILRSFLDQASEKATRYSNNEIRILSTVNVAQMQKQVDAAARELRELDVKIQSLNWATELDEG